MSDTAETVIACSLPMADLSERRSDWQQLAQEALLRRRPIPAGVRLTYTRSEAVERRLGELAALERDCCTFAQWTVERESELLVLDVSAEGDGIAAVRELFELPACEILLICGSLRTGSTNAAVLRTAAREAPTGARASLYEELHALPHFNPDDDRDPLAPAVARLRAEIGSADAVLLCTPEYAGALPGAFKNLLDWTVGGGETYGKPVAWINASGPASPTGGAGAHESLRSVLGYTGADIVEAACLQIPLVRQDVGPDGYVAGEAARRGISEVLGALAAHVVRARAGSAP